MLFGGLSSLHSQAPIALTDTWIFDGTQWSQLGIAGPSGRGRAGRDTFEGKAIVVGGVETNGFPANDMWAWNGAAWSPIESPNLPPAPGPVAALDGKLIMVSNLGNTWSWDGKAWESLPPLPSGRTPGPAATFQGKVVLYGGSDKTTTEGDRCLVDTWSFDGVSWKQETFDPPIGGGCVLPGPAMAELGDKLIRVDPLNWNEHKPGTYAWDGKVWTKLPVETPLVREASLARLGDKLVLFGGEDTVDTGSLTASTWVFDGAAWVKLAIAGPSPRASAVLVESP